MASLLGGFSPMCPTRNPTCLWCPTGHRIELSPCPPPNAPPIQFPRKQGCAAARPSGKSGPLGALTLPLPGMWPGVHE